MKRFLWWMMVLGGSVGVLAHATVRADGRPPVPKIGYVCVAGLAVELARDDKYDGTEGTDGGWPALMPVERCRLPLMPNGLPGEHLLSAVTVDRAGGVTAAKVAGEKGEALSATTAHLEAQGWREAPSSVLARGRNARLDLAVMQRRDAVLHIAAVEGEGEGESTIIVAAGLFGGDETGGAR